MSIGYLVPAVTYGITKLIYMPIEAIPETIDSEEDNMNYDPVGTVFLIIGYLLLACFTIPFVAIFWFMSFGLFRLLSQYREYAADRGSAAVTGEPLALASALEKIDDEIQTLPVSDLRKVDGGVEALYFSPLGVTIDGKGAEWRQKLLPNSHPPTQERIECLADMAEELEDTP